MDSDKKSFQQSLKDGQKIEKWRINYFLGYGRIMEAYEVQDVPNPRKKTLLIERLDLDNSASEELRKNMPENIEILKAFNHPHVSEIFEKGEHRQRVWYVREHGQHTLEELITKRGKLTLPEIQGLMIHYLKGLEAIHENKYIHGDISTRNLMVSSNGKGFITDLEFNYFKESNKLKNSLSKTTKGKTLLNLEFSAPEQKGETKHKITHQSDLYSLMKVYSKAIAGRQLEINERLRHIQKDIPRRLEKLINKNLKINPNHRHESAKEIRQELEKIKHTSLHSRIHSIRNFISDMHFLYKVSAIGIPILAGFLINNLVYDSPTPISSKNTSVRISQKPVPELKKPEIIPKETKKQIPETKPEIPKKIKPSKIEKKVQPIIDIEKTINPEEYVYEEPTINKDYIPEKTKKQTKAYIPEVKPKIIIKKQRPEFKPREKPEKQIKEYTSKIEQEIEKIETPKEPVKKTTTTNNSLNYRMSLLYHKLEPIKYKQKMDLDSLGMEIGVPITDWLEFFIRGTYAHEKERVEVSGGFANSRSTNFNVSGNLDYILINNNWLKLYAGAGIGQTSTTSDITGVIGMSEINDTNRSKNLYWIMETGADFKLTKNLSLKTWINYIDYNKIKDQNTETAWGVGAGININFP